MFRRIAIFVYTFKWPILMVMIMLTLIAGGAMFRLSIDPSMETLFVKSSAEYKYYHEYSEKYGSDQMIAVAMAAQPDLFEIAHLKKLVRLSDKIAQYPQVERVLSLANAKDIRHKFIGVKTVDALEGAFNGERPLKQIKWDILSNELYRNNLISRNGKIANILIYLKPAGKDLTQSGQFIKDLRKLTEAEESPVIKFYIAGSPVEQYDFIRLIRRDQFTFVPLIALLLIGTTLVIYRSFSCMLLAMSIVFMTLVWTMGTIVLVGCELNLMTSLLAPVIMIVAVVNSIYLMNLFFEIRPHQTSLKRAVALTVEQLGVPCLLTHFTTVLGFISLALTPIPAIQSFGIFAALGTFYSYIMEIIMTPILLPTLPYRVDASLVQKNQGFRNLLVRFIERLDFHWKWLILILTCAIVILSYFGIKRVEVDTNIVKQMKPDLPLAVSTRFIDENLTGVYSLGFVLKRKNGASFVDSQTLKRIDEFKSFMEAMPEISKVNSITTVLKKIHEARHDDPREYKIPDSAEDLKRYFEGIAASGDPEVWKFISRDFREVRLEARMRAVGTREGARVEERARQYLREKLGWFFDYQLTGNVVLLGRMAKGLVHEQLQSFIVAFISILAVIILIFRSFKLGLLAAIPNLIPILAVYGLMGFLRIELSTPTAMISSIVLGMVVDASIQFIYRFQIEFKRRGYYLQALHHTYRIMGQSMVVSTLILCIGFASSVFASFRPTVHFGVLTSLTIFFALVCTLVVLPVCILMVKPFGRQRLFSRAPAENSPQK